MRKKLLSWCVVTISLPIIFAVTTSHSGQSNGLEFEGLIEPFEIVNVGTPVEGVVNNVLVKRSSQVKKGQELVELENSVESSVVQRARALAALEGELTLQNEKLEFAKRIFSRVEQLFQNDAISEEKRDQAATEVELAKARLKKAVENRKLANLDLIKARAILELRKIKSPISGIVIERFISPGEFVDNQPLLKIAQMDPLRVEVVLPADLFRRIKPGMKATVKPETETGVSYASTVEIVDRVIDPASGTFGVRLMLPNPKYHLPSGLKCLVRFDGVERENKLEAIQESGEGNEYEISPLLSKVIQ